MYVVIRPIVDDGEITICELRVANLYNGQRRDDNDDDDNTSV